VREALATEMLEALGVHTSKTLSFFETGEKLQRHDEPSPTRAAVLVRLSHSHVRYGCFQFQEYNQRPQQVLELLRYTCRHYFPQLVCETPERLPGLLLAEVVKRGARFAAELTVAGFVHGVLNTDNMNVTGESFDYGPYRFAPRFDPRFVAAYFDHSGLYSFGRQAEAVRWNLGHLARVLSLRCPVLCDPRGLELALKDFWPCFHQERTRLLLGRLGLIPRGDARDAELTGKVEEFLESSGVGLAQFFFDWFGGKRSQDRARRSPQGDLYRGDAFDSILGLFDEFEEEAGELLQVEYFQRERPCDLLIEEVESIWDPISKEDDWSLFEAKLRDIREMARALGNGSGASV
jgi:uncharacterized protein YdiU (UPF0061 family)